ncbi:hypothetical protein TUBRATIS_009970 [Tubulinosema ratisbonensis]|uniref:Uncharacterized protein n=1 Tax=Tubulinosema ratisbonensis TaxID=291195 RepID=A0A437AMW8_9MICR|nr:hypothetical protein TUBRATIS_009970 [Tubulinosema ratisbonensis]
MNLTKYLITFLIFVSVTIFSTAGVLMGNRNSSTAASNINQSYKPIIIRNIILKNDKSKPQKRSVIDENIQSNSTNVLDLVLGNVKEIKLKKGDLVSLYFKTEDLKLNAEEINEFVDNFEKEMSELATVTDQENKTVRRISVRILEKHYSLLEKLKNLKNELENSKKLFNELTVNNEKSKAKDLDKTILWGSEYDAKYTDELLNELKDDTERSKKILNIYRKSVCYYDQVYENINSMFEIFFYSYEFDTVKFNKEELRDLFNFLRVREFDYAFEKVSFDDFTLSINIQIEKLRMFSNINFITKDFYLKFKEFLESVANLANDLAKEINQYSDKWSFAKKKIVRFIEKMEDAFNEDE